MGSRLRRGTDETGADRLIPGRALQAQGTRSRARPAGSAQLHAATLDNVEMEVVGYCDDLYAARRNEYRRHRSALEERMQPPPSDRGADSLVENTCKEMRDAVARSVRTCREPRGRRSRAIARSIASGSSRGATPTPTTRRAACGTGESWLPWWSSRASSTVSSSAPTSRADCWPARVTQSLSASSTWRVLGWLIAAMVRQVHHRDPRRRVGGLRDWPRSSQSRFSGICSWPTTGRRCHTTIPGARRPAGCVFGGRAVSAAQSGAAPSPAAFSPGGLAAGGRSSAEQSPSAQTPQTDPCRAAGGAPTKPTPTRKRSASSAPARSGLGGFYSYMLLLVGLAMCAAAAMDWFKTDDPYPGYGKRERHRRKTEERLEQDRRELWATSTNSTTTPGAGCSTIPRPGPGPANSR